MTETCLRGCTDKEGLPALTEEGLLCRRCYRKLTTLLGPPEDRESLSGAIQWLESNQGQYLRSSTGGSGTGDGSTYGDHMVAAMSHIKEIRHSVLELVNDFSPTSSTNPAGMFLYLNLWRTKLAHWEPIGDHLDHLEDLMDEAHSISPWRAKQDQSLHAAALLYLLPPEPIPDLAQRFDISQSWIRSRKDQLPTEDSKTYRPWDLFTLLEPTRSAELLAELLHYRGRLTYTTAA